MYQDLCDQTRFVEIVPGKSDEMNHTCKVYFIQRGKLVYHGKAPVGRKLFDDSIATSRRIGYIPFQGNPEDYV